MNLCLQEVQTDVVDGLLESCSRVGESTDRESYFTLPSLPTPIQLLPPPLETDVIYLEGERGITAAADTGEEETLWLRLALPFPVCSPPPPPRAPLFVAPAGARLRTQRRSI